MFNVKTISQLILMSTIFSLVLLISFKFLEIQTQYPRSNFCLTCYSFEEGFVRVLEVQLNFNLFLLADFLVMLMVVLLFGLERYYEHVNFLIICHMIRFMLNGANLAVSDTFDRLLKPMMKELCGFGGKCSDEKILPHTTVGLLYLIYFAIMVTNFSVCVLLTYFFVPYTQYQPAPIIVHMSSHFRRSRPIRKFSFTNSFQTPPHSSSKRSPSPPKLVNIVYPPEKPLKYHRLESNDKFMFRHSKNKVMPLTLPQPQPMIMA
ncbi:Protein CBG11041 [Caenorhabditis briggsae]|nr:Protein CBG11041 [Caenorhabditis briggsae]CAP30268.2 Protein CBG11041 [Caenorhabditis briggsae]